MSMIEKVGAAIAKEISLATSLDDLNPAWIARAAIEAMEPTAAMARAMKPRPAHWPPRGADAAMDASIDADRLAAKQMFTAAIQAALEGEG